MNSNVPRVHPQHALAVYVEELAVGRRVAVFGDASLGMGARLAELGAHSVAVWDPDTERARREAERAAPGVTVHALGADDLDEREGAFHLAVVADLGLFDDAEELLALVRRLVGDLGVALLAAQNRAVVSGGAFDYYELFDLVSREFDEVTMIAQLPFYGLALAELGVQEEEDESLLVSVDTQLAGGDRTPEVFIALASQRGVRLDPYAIVELGTPPPRPEEVADVQKAHLALVQAQVRTDALEAQVEELRVRYADAQLTGRTVQRLEEGLRERSLRIAELEGTFAAGAAQLEELAVRADRAERSLGPLQAELAGMADFHASETARYEEALRDRARAIRLLEADVLRQERMIRELVDSLDESAQLGPAPAAPEEPRSPVQVVPLEESAQLRHKLDALALELARREGEAQASAWTIEELQRRVDAAEATPIQGGSSPPEPAPDPALERRLASALDELDVLRRALAQEHEARIRAESNERTTLPHAEAHGQEE